MCVQFGPLSVALRPALAVRVGSVVSTRSLTASVGSAFCTVIGAHVSNGVQRCCVSSNLFVLLVFLRLMSVLSESLLVVLCFIDVFCSIRSLKGGLSACLPQIEVILPTDCR